MSKFDYLVQFIKESMRIDTTTTIVARYLESPVELPDGRVIPKGKYMAIDLVLVLSNHIQRRSKTQKYLPFPMLVSLFNKSSCVHKRTIE